MKLGILTTLFIIKCINSQHLPGNAQCKDLNPQNEVDIDEIQGLWYGKEIITHQDTVHGESANDACVLIHLSDKTHEFATARPRRPDQFDEYHNRQAIQYDYNHPRPYGAQYYHYLQLIWTGPDTTIEYTLRYNTTKRGFWIASAPQKGTMMKLNYGQFAGIVQVMKAVGHHMVLTFCDNQHGSQFFSIILSRHQNTLSADDLQSVRSLLARRGLSTISVRQVCNGSVSIYNSITLTYLFLSTIIVSVVRKF